MMRARTGRCQNDWVITTVLVNHAPLVRVLFWIALAVLTAMGWVVHRHHARKTLVTLGIVSLLGVVALTMTPSGEGSNGIFCTVQFSVPFEGIDTLANVALLFPLTLFVALLSRRPLRVLVAASGLSALIELVQAFLAALGRACDTNDWFMNTVGAVLGALIAAVILAMDRRQRTRVE